MQPAARPDSYKHFTARYKASVKAKVDWVWTLQRFRGGMALWFLGVFLLPSTWVPQGLPGAASKADSGLGLGDGHPWVLFHSAPCSHHHTDTHTGPGQCPAESTVFTLWS